MTNAVAATDNRLVETVDLTITRNDQDVNFFWLTKINGHKVRFRICSNPYAFQCSASASIWAPDRLAWNTVATLLDGERKTPPKLVYKQDWANAAPFQDDANHLLALVLAILL